MDPSTNPVRIKANLNRVRVMYQGHVIADTRHALTVIEDGHAPVQYFPREDVETAYFGKTQRHTRCPFKGEASYFTLAMDGAIAENAAWSYENVRSEAMAIKDYIAFYPQWVEIYELTPADEAREPRAAHPHGLGPSN